MTWYGVVAGSNYEGSAAQLRGCLNDVVTNASLLGSMGAQVEILKGPQATRAAILETFAAALQGAGENDGVEFAWSGHGTNARDRDGDEHDHADEAIVPDDYQRQGVITDDQLYELAAPAFARGVRVVLKLDSCYSGQFHRLIMAADDQGVLTGVRFLPPSWLPDGIRPAEAAGRGPRVKARPGALAFSACQESQLAQEYPADGRVQGAFTYHSTRALVSLLERGDQVSYRDWAKATVLRVNDPDQVPILTGTASQRRWLVGKERGRK